MPPSASLPGELQKTSTVGACPPAPPLPPVATDPNDPPVSSPPPLPPVPPVVFMGSVPQPRSSAAQPANAMTKVRMNGHWDDSELFVGLCAQIASVRAFPRPSRH